MRRSGCVQWTIWLAALLLAFGGCVPESGIVAPGVPVSPTPDATAGWVTLAPGLEWRRYFPNGDTLAEIVALRIDPSLYVFRSHYRLGEPYTLRQWMEMLPDAVALVNSNFFDTENRIIGLLVTDGVAYGYAFPGYGGMFAVEEGMPRVRSNALDPYHGESLEQAIQAFPMLVQDGLSVYTNIDSDTPQRRAAIGQDGQGRIILMATPRAGLRLADLSAYLAASDMGLVNAFNLDGGGSTMMYIHRELPYLLRSFTPVPAVLAVYARE